MAVVFNTCLIYYVISQAAVPLIKSIKIIIMIFLLFSGLIMFCIVHYEAGQVMCYDPEAASFSPEDVKKSELNAFAWAYFLPVSISFFIVLSLLIMTWCRLQRSFNAALLYLVQRLIPYPLIFCLAYIPFFLFQIIILLTGGKRIYFLKGLGLVGVNISGAAFGVFYLRVHLKSLQQDNSESNPINSADTNTSHPSIRRDLSWTNSTKSYASSRATIQSERTTREVTSGQRDTFLSFFATSQAKTSEGKLDSASFDTNDKM